MRVGGQRHPRPFYPRERDPLPIVQEAGRAPGPVWTGAENLAPTGLRSPDRPARGVIGVDQCRQCRSAHTWTY